MKKNVVRNLIPIALIGLAAAVAMMMSGCASARPAVVLTADGPAAGINIGNQDGNFFQNHWGKVLSIATGAGGLTAVARNNHWFGWGKHDPDYQANGNSSQSIVVQPKGDNNTTYVYLGENQGNNQMAQ